MRTGHRANPPDFAVRQNRLSYRKTLSQPLIFSVFRAPLVRGTVGPSQGFAARFNVLAVVSDFRHV